MACLAARSNKAMEPPTPPLKRPLCLSVEPSPGAAAGAEEFDVPPFTPPAAAARVDSAPSCAATLGDDVETPPAPPLPAAEVVAIDSQSTKLGDGAEGEFPFGRPSPVARAAQA
eukprot:15436488-Alexandrium_andersonii.AAC.1